MEFQPCPQHKRSKDYDIARGTSAQRLYDGQWRIARAEYLRLHPFCEGECRLSGRVTLAYAVDHIVPHRGDSKIFWDRTNWQSLCQREHNSKSARERLNLLTGRS